MASKLTYQEANELKKRVAHVDQETCNHSRIAREYINGMHSDYVCEDCGLAYTNRELFKKKSSS